MSPKLHLILFNIHSGMCFTFFYRYSIIYLNALTQLVGTLLMYFLNVLTQLAGTLIMSPKLHLILFNIHSGMCLTFFIGTLLFMSMR